MVIWVYPSFEAEVDLDQLLAAYPEPVLQVMGVQTMASLGGFLSFELYTFGWIILLGLYLAYATAGAIADDVDRGRMDVLLSMPISRSRVVAERFAAMTVPIVGANVLPPIVVYVGARLIDHPSPPRTCSRSTCFRSPICSPAPGSACSRRSSSTGPRSPSG